MSLTTTPAPARTDEPARSNTDAPAPSTRSVRIAGVLTAAGSAAWAGSILAFGLGGDTPVEAAVYHSSTLLFQVGLVALVAVQLGTRATGTGRLARGFLHVEHVLLGLAMLATLQTIFVPAWDDHPVAIGIDAFWPISMLGMFAIGIRIAIAGRWSGAARWWPLGAESWAPVNVPLVSLAPELSPYVAAGHLLVGYAGLGLLMTLRPELTGARG
jgi:hypothetical protein